MCSSRPATRGRIRSTSPASSAFAAAWSTSSLPAPRSRSGSSSSATRSSRSAPTTRRRSVRASTLDQAAIAPLQELPGFAAAGADGPGDEADTERPAVFADYLAGAAARRSSSPSRTKWSRTDGSCRSRSSASYDEAVEQGTARARASPARCRLGHGGVVAREAHRARNARASNRRTPTAACTSPVSRRRVRGPGAGLGRRDPPRAASAATRWSSSRNSAGRAERTIELLADYDVFAVPIERAEDAHAASRARRRRPSDPRLPAARRAAAALGRDRRLRGGAQGPRAPPIGHAHVPLRFPRSEGRRPRRPRRSRHRPLRRPEADRRRPRAAGVHGAPLRRRGQALRPGRAARSRSEVHRRGAPGARPARRHHLGKGQDARQEGDARHGRGAAEALRRAQGRPRPRLHRRTPTGSRSSKTRSSGS